MESRIFLLSWDIQFLIFLNLPLSAITSLRKTCRRLKSRISEDKQLWLVILDRDVLSQNINLHPLRTQLEAASAVYIESWIRCAIHLQRAHQVGMRPTATRIKLDLRVTWLKIIRTCWCLVASSSEGESRLTIWHLKGTSPCISKEYYLPGPVVDGVIDDDGSDVVVALTIGTKDMYIHVLSIFAVSGATTICALATLHCVSYVRMLNGPWIVCAVRNGDDTYPILINWKNNHSWKLVPRWYIDHANLPWGLLHSAVCTGTRWLDWIVLVMNRTVEIYSIADCESIGDEIVAIASLPVIVSRTYGAGDSDIMDVEEASFHGYDWCRSREGRPILSFSCRIKNGCYSLFSVLFTGSDFLIREAFLQDALDTEEFPSSGNKFVVGLASNYEVHLRAEGGYSILPSLIFVKIDRSHVDNAVVSVDRPRAIKDGFPLLHFTTGIDYDDGVGLLVIGTCKGYLCIARFLPEEMIAVGSLTDELPTQTIIDEELSLIPVGMDIPSYYLHVQKSKYDFDLPLQLIEETVKTWPSLPEGSLTSGPWSSDWLRYDRVRHWVIPADRWPMNDTASTSGGYYNFFPAAAYIRLSRTALGEIIPLAYRLDPEIVVFRIGPRHYMVTIYRDTDEAEFVCGALPNLDAGAPLDGGLLENISRSNIQDNLSKRYGNTGDAELAEAAERIDYLLDVVARNACRLESELSKVGSDANWWSLEDLQMIHKKATVWMELQ